MTTNEHKQLIQNFLNCCIMETQGKPVTHEDLEKLLEFYLNGEINCSDLTCHQKEVYDYSRHKTLRIPYSQRYYRG